MKKVLKLIGRIFKIIGIAMAILAGIIAIFVAFLGIRHHILLSKEAEIVKGSYGEMVDIEGGKICVDIEGNGEEVIVLTPGFCSTSPVLEMKGVINALKERYTVVTIEPFGYGLSDQTKRQRTIENISEEMHEVLSKLDYRKYMMMGHSISGVYALYYTNQYPEEVTAYIGIDSAVPKQNLEEDSEGGMLSYTLLSLMNRFGIYRFLAGMDQEGVVPTVKGYAYTDQERQVYEALTYKNFLNTNMLQEFKNTEDNFNKSMSLKFPSHIPVLYFLSTQNCEESPNWQALHEEVITRKTEGQIIILEGSHYLHYTYGYEMAHQLEVWKNGL